MTAAFSAARWGRLLTHRLADSAKPLALALGVVAGLHLVVLLLVSEAGSVFEGGLWGLFVLFAAVFTAASAFKPMHEGRSATDWLLLPATAEEKWAAALAETLVVPLVLVLASGAAAALVSAAGWLLHGRPGPLWFPWEDRWFSNPGALSVLLLVFFAGSASFRKNALWKTGLVLVAVGVTTGLVSMALLRVTGHLSADFSFGAHGGPAFRGSFGHPGSAGPGADAVKLLANLWFDAAVPLFCLAFSWAKVREKEARDEVQ